MARQSSRPRRANLRKADAGMGRFFSPANLDRYRKLANGADDAERRRILEDLAMEMNSFRREARTAAVAGPCPRGGEIGSGAGDRT